MHIVVLSGEVRGKGKVGEGGYTKSLVPSGQADFILIRGEGEEASCLVYESESIEWFIEDQAFM